MCSKRILPTKNKATMNIYTYLLSTPSQKAILILPSAGSNKCVALENGCGWIKCIQWGIRIIKMAQDFEPGDYMYNPQSKIYIIDIHADNGRIFYIKNVPRNLK